MAIVSTLVAFASQHFPKFSSRILASSGYTLDVDRFGPNAFGMWKADAARRQDAAWQPIIERAKQGHPREDVAALFQALDPIVSDGTSLLEVGCGGGYNSDAILHRYPSAVYSGLDLSEAMIEIARAHYPDRPFAVASAYELPQKSSSIDVVMDGVALIHMPDWPRAIGEYARVARSHVVLHGLTLTDKAPTTTFAKYAYGQPSMELVFNRTDMLAECERHGLTLGPVHDGLDYDLEHYIGIPSVSETWVLRV